MQTNVGRFSKANFIVVCEYCNVKGREDERYCVGCGAPLPVVNDEIPLKYPVTYSGFSICPPVVNVTASGYWGGMPLGYMYGKPIYDAQEYMQVVKEV